MQHGPPWRGEDVRGCFASEKLDGCRGYKIPSPQDRRRLDEIWSDLQDTDLVPARREELLQMAAQIAAKYECDRRLSD